MFHGKRGNVETSGHTVSCCAKGRLAQCEKIRQQTQTAENKDTLLWHGRSTFSNELRLTHRVCTVSSAPSEAMHPKCVDGGGEGLRRFCAEWGTS
jgi:hypothetical protein